MQFGFGDARLNERAAWIMDRIVAVGSIVLRKVGETRAGEIAIHRFLDNKRVDDQGVIDAMSAMTIENCCGRRIVAAQDTTEINFSGRDKKRSGLGPGGDGKALGFFIHPVIAVDADDEAIVGVVDAEIWTRDDVPKAERRKRSQQDKESQRWLKGAQASAERLVEAEQVIVIGDRESDIFFVFAQKPDSIDLIVRAAHNRKTASGGSVFDEALPCLGEITVDVPAKPSQKARTARLLISANSVTVNRPRNGLREDLPKTVTLNVVETKEIDPPEGVTPLHWRLYTTLPVDTLELATDVVRLYRLRWRIEEVFRVLKTDGLSLGDTQVEDRKRLFTLSALALGAATRIMQLTNARDGSPRRASDAIDADLIEPVAAIGKRLEGKTERQKNPHQKGQLAWLSWIVARLGGWNCYYKPPGPKTMATGWRHLAAMLEGFLIATQPAHV